MRVLGYIAIGFFLCYMVLEGGPKEAIHRISGEIYWNTLPDQSYIEREEINDRVEDFLENMQ